MNKKTFIICAFLLNGIFFVNAADNIPLATKVADLKRLVDSGYISERLDSEKNLESYVSPIFKKLRNIFYADEETQLRITEIENAVIEGGYMHEQVRKVQREKIASVSDFTEGLIQATETFLTPARDVAKAILMLKKHNLIPDDFLVNKPGIIGDNFGINLRNLLELNEAQLVADPVASLSAVQSNLAGEQIGITDVIPGGNVGNIGEWRALYSEFKAAHGESTTTALKFLKAIINSVLDGTIDLRAPVSDGRKSISWHVLSFMNDLIKDIMLFSAGR